MAYGGWVIFFLLLLILTGVLSFFVLVGTAATIVKWLFIFFLVLFAISLIKYLISN
ncbi:MAG: DUF1328 domain-containing protein [Nanoarchaeota archaeon]|nr:DUF1328 domain-containing protein [Nanoarchaeota archaeon]